MNRVNGVMVCRDDAECRLSEKGEMYCADNALCRHGRKVTCYAVDNASYSADSTTEVKKEL
ncbi:MAG: hypothetical protein ACR2PX_18185 [Endozoicomonas sp.]|uniref:hypothetical protein n=1 Tax=Endozoicomonas sp. TaxID=1892382 RepID=UPI003D9B7D2E